MKKGNRIQFSRVILTKAEDPSFPSSAIIFWGGIKASALTELPTGTYS